MSFDMNRAWGEAMRMLSANREVLLVVAGIFFFLPSMFLSLVMPQLPPGFAFTDREMAQLEVTLEQFYATWWWLVLLTFAATLVGWLALLALLRDDARPTVGQAIATGLKGTPTALAVFVLLIAGLTVLSTVMAALSTALGQAALAILAVFALFFLIVALGVRMALVSPVIAIEGVMNPLAVVRRSWQLTRGNGWRLFAFFALFTIVYIVLSAVGTMIMAVVMLVAGDSAGLFISSAVGGVIGAVVSVVMVAVIASIHRQLSGAPHRGMDQTFG